MDRFEILCYGDSNTWGSVPRWKDSTLPAERYDTSTRWTMVAQKRLGESYHIIEEGLGGRTSIYELPGQPFKNGLPYLPPCLMSHRPLDLVVMMLGSNDLNAEIQPPLEELGVGIRTLIETLKGYPSCGRGNKAPKILVVAPSHIKRALGRVAVYDQFRADRGGDLSKAFACVYEKIAQETGCAFLNAADYAAPSDADGLHWTADSHVSFGAAVAERIRDLLGDPERFE